MLSAHRTSRHDSTSLRIRPNTHWILPGIVIAFLSFAKWAMGNDIYTTRISVYDHCRFDDDYSIITLTARMRRKEMTKQNLSFTYVCILYLTQLSDSVLLSGLLFIHRKANCAQ